MANWGLPIITDLYTNFMDLLKARDDDCAKMFDGVTTSNLPTSTIRWTSANNRWEKWNGTTWGSLTAAYNINVTNFNGQLASFYTNASNLNAGTLPATRFNDTSHGFRSSATLHALATTTSHGFLSSSLKSKLDGIENNATADQTKLDIDALKVDAGSLNGNDFTLSGFRAYIPANYSHSSGLIVRFSAESYDLGSDFNTSTYKYTTPTNGFYSVTSLVSFAANTASDSNVKLILYKNSSVLSQSSSRTASLSVSGVSFSDMFFLSAGDILEFRLEVAGGLFTIIGFSSQSSFCVTPMHMG